MAMEIYSPTAYVQPQVLVMEETALKEVTAFTLEILLSTQKIQHTHKRGKTSSQESDT
jgi:hypothetical protein